MSKELEVLKMFDTHPEIAVRYRELMMRKSGQQRLVMGCSMYDTAKEIVRSEIFLRFYGQEFSEADRKKLISALASE